MEGCGRGARRCVVLEAPRPTKSAIMNNYVIPPYHRQFFTKDQIRQALEDAGWPPETWATMTAIAGAESSYSNAIQKEQPYATTGWGTWQITPGNSVPSIAVDLALLDLVTNARAALVKWRTQGYRAWTTWSNGVYRRYL